MKKNNTAEKTIQNAEKITKALKEGTEKSLRDIMNEALSNLVSEEDDNDNEEVEDDSYDVEDVNTEETPAVEDGAAEDSVADDDNAEDTEDAEAGEEGSEEDDADEWSDMEQYKVGDNDYDFTGVDGDEVLKVYNKLGDDDQIFVKKEDDGTYSVKDDETGAEFVIELDPEAMGGSEADEDFGGEDDFGGDEEGDDEMSFDIEDDSEEDFGGDEDAEGDEELEIDLNDEDDDEEALNEEDLGYTDSYQKDVFAKKFNMNEPADSKTTNDWDEGAPKGSSKPWAGKGDMKPFNQKKDTVDECGAFPEEQANLEEDGTGLNTKHSMKKVQNRLNKNAQNQKLVSQNGEYKGNMEESIAKIYKAAKAIQAENKQLKEQVVPALKKAVYEAAVLNVNEGRLINLLVNETLTKAEKVKLCERFNAVKTIAEGKTLQESIKLELNEAKKSSPNIEKQFVAESKNLNETTIYVNDPSLDLMNRMDNLSGFYKK